MPTFMVLKGSQKVEEMKGANPAALTALLKKHAPSAAGGSAGASSTAAPTEKGLEGFVSLSPSYETTTSCGAQSLRHAQTSLNSSIDLSQIHCLNEASGHTIKDLLRGGGDKWLESDADEQLLLQIPVRILVLFRA